MQASNLQHTRVVNRAWQQLLSTEAATPVQSADTSSSMAIRWQGQAHLSTGLHVWRSAAADPVDAVSTRETVTCGCTGDSLQLQGTVEDAGLVKACGKRL